LITRRGWWVALLAVLFMMAGRLFGLPELYAVAVASGALLAGAVIYVRRASWRVDAERQLRPPRVHAGGTARVELSLRNLAPHRSPVLAVRDPFDGGRRWARFHVAPMTPGELSRAAYRLPTDRRGLFPLGPLEVSVGDPFGLAIRSVEAAGGTVLTVYPRLDDVRSLPFARGADLSASAGRASLSPSGDEFFALREYRTGDDLRRVHWPSTARSDELMIRQDEFPWQGRVCVVLDLRAVVHSPESLEVVVSAAASIVHAGWRDRRQVRLAATDGTDSGYGTGHAHLEAMLEYLASAGIHAGQSLAEPLKALGRGGPTGGVAVVTTDRVSSGDLRAIGRHGGRFGTLAVVLVEHDWAGGVESESLHRPAPAGLADAPGARLVRVSARTPFPLAWEVGVFPRPPRRMAAATTLGDAAR
jgi:uncharacterized protein (DUF58 family)